MDDYNGRLYCPRETSLIKSSIIVHVHYSFLGDSWSKLLCWLWTMPLDELELDLIFCSPIKEYFGSYGGFRIIFVILKVLSSFQMSRT